ncbi:MAG: phosphate signaling complex protein PhoU [Pseudomonadota bacterium]
MPFGLLKSVTGRLEKVDIALATMGGVVEQQVADAISSFEKADIPLAEAVCERDQTVDEHDKLIERQVVDILEEKSPTGSDLRRAMTAIKIAAEMERIGDLSKNVAKRTTVIADLDDVDISQGMIPGTARMGRRALTQFGESLDCLFQNNPEAALVVRDADDQIDDLYNSIFREILLGMTQYSAGVLLGTHLVFVAKNFERIGDHATNIAERVHYTITGLELTEERHKTDQTSVAPLEKEILEGSQKASAPGK